MRSWRRTTMRSLDIYLKHSLKSNSKKQLPKRSVDWIYPSRCSRGICRGSGVSLDQAMLVRETQFRPKCLSSIARGPSYYSHSDQIATTTGNDLLQPMVSDFQVFPPFSSEGSGRVFSSL